MACCGVLLHMYERFVRYISKNAIVQMGIWGDDYMTAAKKAFFLDLRHQGRIGLVDDTVSFLLGLQEVATGFVGFLVVHVLILFMDTNFFGESLKFVETAFGPAFFVFYIGAIIGKVAHPLFPLVNIHLDILGKLGHDCKVSSLLLCNG